MKKQFQKIALVGAALFLLYSTTTQAQRYKVRRAIEKNIEEKNEKEHGDDGKEKGNKWLDNLNDVKLKSEYKLTESLTYVTIKYKRGKPQENKADTVVILSNAAQKLIGTRSQDGKKGNTYTIMDMGNMASIMFMTANMEMMAFNAKAMMSSKTQAKLKQTKSDGNVKPNGKTKTILGYTCKGYDRTDEDGTKTDEMYIADIKEFKEAGMVMPTMGMGFGNVMESTHYKKGEIQQVMTATEVNKKLNLSFRTADYTRQGMLHID